MKRGIYFGWIIVSLVVTVISMAQDSKPTSETEAELIAKATAALQKKNISQFVYILESGVDKGFPLCAYNLGMYYRLKNDFPKANNLFLKASLAGCNESQMELSLLYAEGKGVEKNLINSIFWVGTAAKSGYKPAIEVCRLQNIEYRSDEFGLTIENLIFYGYPWREFLPSDQTQTSLVTEPELCGNAKKALQRGDFTRARYLMAQGVAAGFPSCTYDLGMMRYLAGEYSVSYKLFLQASLSGHSEAQYMLAKMYSEGLGVQKNIVKSNFWMGTSAKTGNQPAIKQCNEKNIYYKNDNYGLSIKNLRKHGYQ